MTSPQQEFEHISHEDEVEQSSETDVSISSEAGNLTFSSIFNPGLNQRRSISNLPLPANLHRPQSSIRLGSSNFSDDPADAIGAQDANESSSSVRSLTPPRLQSNRLAADEVHASGSEAQILQYARQPEPTLPTTQQHRVQLRNLSEPGQINTSPSGAGTFDISSSPPPFVMPIDNRRHVVNRLRDPFRGSFSPLQNISLVNDSEVDRPVGITFSSNYLPSRTRDSINIGRLYPSAGIRRLVGGRTTMDRLIFTPEETSPRWQPFINLRNYSRNTASRPLSYPSQSEGEFLLSRFFENTESQPLESDALLPNLSNLQDENPFLSDNSLKEEPDDDDDDDECFRDWRLLCANSKDRWRNALESGRFTDVSFTVGGCFRPDSAISAPHVPKYSRSRPSFSHMTSLIESRDEDYAHRIISSAIAQVSGMVSRGASSPSGLEEDKCTPAEKASRLTDILLSMQVADSSANDAHFTPQLPHKYSSSPSDDNDQPSVAVMCNFSDTSDVDSLKYNRMSTSSICTQTPIDSSQHAQLPVTSSIEIGRHDSTESKHGHVSSKSDRELPRQESPDSTVQPYLIECVEPKRFSAHKVILALASPVFEAMFFGSFAENSVTRSSSGANQESMELFVSDVSPSAFQQCLRYIYYDDIQLPDNIDEIFDVLYAAKKYLLPQLAVACTTRLINDISPENILVQLSRSCQFNDEELVKICWHSIDLLSSDVLSSDLFVELSREVVMEFISRDTLCCAEWEIFEAVKRWAQADCRRRGLPDCPVNISDAMTDFIPVIRFTAMSLEDFVLHVAKSSVLSLEAQRDISIFIATKIFTVKDDSIKGTDFSKPDTDPVTSSPSKAIFLSNPLTSSVRLPRTGPTLFRCYRYPHLIAPSAKDSYWQDVEAVAFETSSTVYLAGVGVSEPVSKAMNFKVKIEVKRCRLIRQSVPSDSTGFRTTGVLTNQSTHRHLHQRTNVATQSPFQQRYSDLSRRNRFSSSHLEPKSSRPFSRPYPYVKLAISRNPPLASIESIVQGSGSKAVFDVRFQKPIRLVAKKSYVIIVKPEDGRSTRCYLNSIPPRSEVKVRTRQAGSVHSSSPFISPASNHVMFNFSFCEKTPLNCSTEGSHIPQILFYASS